MNETHSRLVLWPVLACAVFGLQGGCAENPGTLRAKNPSQGDKPPVSWHSPRIIEIKKQWDSLAQIRTNLKDGHEDLQMAMRTLLARELSDENVRQLAATCDALPVEEKDRSNFDNAVLQFMVEILVDAGDREHLVELFATRCPSRVYPLLPIELYLPMFGYKLKDPIKVLGEAYSRCKVPEVRHVLAAAVRRGFAGFGIQGTDDAEFVKNAMQWYEKEKDHLTLNRTYYRNDEMFELELYDRMPQLYNEFPGGHKRELLFERRRDSDGVPAASRETTADRTRDKPVPEHASVARTNDAELARLQGTWEMVSITSDGKPVPPDRVKGRKVVFAEEKLTMIAPGGEKDDEWRVRLNLPQQPGAMDLVGPGTKYMKEVITPALYELEGDTLRLCLPGRGALRRPTALESPPHSGLNVITLERSSP